MFWLKQIYTSQSYNHLSLLTLGHLEQKNHDSRASVLLHVGVGRRKSARNSSSMILFNRTKVESFMIGTLWWDTHLSTPPGLVRCCAPVAGATRSLGKRPPHQPFGQLPGAKKLHLFDCLCLSLSLGRCLHFLHFLISGTVRFPKFP